MKRAFVALALLSGCQGVEAPTLSETAQSLLGPGILFSPPSGQDFGNVQVSQTSAGLAVTIYPTGYYDMYASIDSITGCPGFDIQSPGPGHVAKTCMTWDTCKDWICEQPAALPQNCLEWYPDETYTFTVSFAPDYPQPYACGISIATSLGARTYNVSGTGTAPAIDIEVTPPAIGFGDVRRGTASAPATAYVRNAGGGPIAVSSVTVTPGFAITAGPTGGYSLPVGTTLPYSVTCNPSAAGPLTGVLRVNSNDPATPNESVSLSCNGIDSALDINPSPLSVTTRVGEPVERTITLFNAGGASMQLDSVNLSGTGLVPVQLPTPGLILGSQEQTIAKVRFDATDAGEATGTIAISYDNGQTRTAAITAIAQPTTMALIPDGTYDFGPVCIGQSKAQDVIILGNADGAFRVDSVSTPAAPFTMTPPSLPAMVQGKGANQLKVSLTAAPTEQATVTSAIDIDTDIPNAPRRTLNVVVTGLPAGVTATPAEIDLGQSKINSTTIGQSVEVSNCGTEAVPLSNPRIEGDHAGDFAIVAQPTLQIDPNGTVKWLIVAQPHDVGTKTAVFSVDYPGGTASVTLLANGITDEILEEDDPRGSYYSCSTGTASTAWPLALVLVPLVRRRRR